MADSPTLELVLRRNSVERLKRERSPLEILDDLPALIATGYADIAEEDVVRLKWWGLYHDKPKVGTFMLRVKLPAGRATAAQLRTIGELSVEHGGGSGELTTRQTIQLHYLRLEALPDVFERLGAAGLTTAGACGDAVRNTTGCPLHGVAHDELFDVTPVIDQVAAFFYGNPAYSNLPRKHKISVSACAGRCNAPEINCISLVGVLRDGEPGFALQVGGGLSSVPRIARDVGVFVRTDQALPVLRALLDAWQEDLRYRVSRVKARMKFMMDDYGPEGIRAEIERRLGHALPSYTLEPLATEPPLHLGVAPQRQPGLVSLGAPVHLGLVSGTQLLELAELAGGLAAELRVTRQQNLVLVNVPEAAAAGAAERLAAIGFPVDGNRLRGGSIACTGEPHCNFSVTETKTRLGALLEGLEERFGAETVSSLRLNLDGCPHACGQHWIGDLGFQGTTARDPEGRRVPAYDVLLRGGLAPRPAIGRPVFKRVPTDELDAAVHGLVAGWLERRADGEGFRDFLDRASDAELGALAGREPTPAKVKEAA